MKQNADKKSTASERRQFFRVEDNIVLHYQAVSDDEMQARKDSQEDGQLNSFTLNSKFAAIRQRSSVLLRDIADHSAAVAKYLANIDKQLDMLAQVLFAQDGYAKEEATSQVNLSAGGLAFNSKEALLQGQAVELRFVLLPDHAGIHCFGRVVHCVAETSHKDFTHRIALEFIDISNEDSDLISKHVFRKQTQRKKQQREKINKED